MDMITMTSAVALPSRSVPPFAVSADRGRPAGYGMTFGRIVVDVPNQFSWAHGIPMGLLIDPATGRRNTGSNRTTSTTSTTRTTAKQAAPPRGAPR